MKLTGAEYIELLILLASFMWLDLHIHLLIEFPGLTLAAYSDKIAFQIKGFC